MHSGFYENALYKFTFTYLLTYNIVGLEAMLEVEDAFDKWCDCCFYQLCLLLN